MWHLQHLIIQKVNILVVFSLFFNFKGDVNMFYFSNIIFVKNIRTLLKIISISILQLFVLNNLIKYFIIKNQLLFANL